jgi:hypothetical protein
VTDRRLALREVRMPHLDTGEMVLVTREELLEHADADHRVLEPPSATRRGGRGGTGA